MAAAALEFRSTTKRFGRHIALDSLSLALYPGEIVGFLGPNGAGKSTAIHLAMGFLRPNSGSGTLAGRAFGDSQARRRVGFLPDNPAFFAGSALRAVELAGKLSGLPKSGLREQASGLLGKLNIVEPQREARKFSRGMQQRTALAAAVVHDPDVLILDEPTSALDPNGVIEVRELLLAARAQGKAIFFSSHQLTEVENICDRIAFLNQGKLVHQGAVADITAHSETVEIMASRLPVNFALPGAAVTPAGAGQVKLLISHLQKRVAIERIWAAGGEIVSLTPQRRSLEDIFIELTKRKS